MGNQNIVHNNGTCYLTHLLIIIKYPVVIKLLFYAGIICAPCHYGELLVFFKWQPKSRTRFSETGTDHWQQHTEDITEWYVVVFVNLASF